MPTSESRARFEKNFQDIDQLIDIYKSLLFLEEDEDDEEESDFSSHKSVVLRSSIVLMVSHWEAYVEDICSEAIDYIVENASSSDGLPKSLRQQISKEVKEDKNELRVWDLAGEKWRDVIKERLSDYHLQRNRKFNNPKSNPVITFFNTYLGIEDISKKWRYKDLTPDGCKRMLDEIVEVRGAIAHRGHPTKELTVELATEYSEFLKSLISYTGGSVNAITRKICGSGLY